MKLSRKSYARSEVGARAMLALVMSLRLAACVQGEHSDGGAHADTTAGDVGEQDASAGDIGPVTNWIAAIPESRCEVFLDEEGVAIDLVQPRDDVTVRFTQLSLQNEDVEELQFQLTRAPKGSRVYLVRETLESGEPVVRMATHEVRRMFRGWDTNQGPDLAGYYVVRAAVQRGGEVELHDCFLDVRSGDALYVELQWNTRETHVELQLIKKDQQRRYCADVDYGTVLRGLAEECDEYVGAPPLTCSRNNCREGLPAPDFDGDGDNGSVGDPVLTPNTTYDFGIETIRIEDATSGTMLVASSTGWIESGAEVEITARVYAYGLLRAQVSMRSGEPGEWREFMILSWREDAWEELCVTDLTSGTESCAKAPQCQPVGGCDQCTDDDACGPGSRCAQEVSECLPQFEACSSDASCRRGEVCFPTTDACAVPECTADDDCITVPDCLPGDECLMPWGACARDALMCYERGATCVRANEPNNDFANATEVLGNIFTDVLCSGDVDVLLLHGRAETGLQLDVTSPTEGAHLRLELYDDTRQPITTSILFPGGAETLEALSQGDQDFYLEIYDLRSAQAVNEYSVVVTHLSRDTCDFAGEPNDTFEEAGNAVLESGAHDLELCGANDEDFFLLHIPPDSRAHVALAYTYVEDVIDMELYDGDSREMLSEACVYTANHRFECVVRNLGSAERSAFVHVRSWGMEPGIQPYQLQVAIAPILSCDDAYEPNDTMSEAAPVGPGVHSSNTCNNRDTDYFALELMESGDIRAVLVEELMSQALMGLMIEDASGQDLVDDWQYGAVPLQEIRQVPAGIYYLVVKPKRDSIGSRSGYSLYVEAPTASETGPVHQPPRDAGFEDAQPEDAVVRDRDAADAGPQDLRAEEASWDVIAEDAI